MINFNQKNLKGIIPILYTFFNKNNSIDIELMKDQISLIVKQQSNGIACLGLASEVNKLSLKEKIKIIELISACCPRHFIKATTIQATTLKDYKKLIDVAKVNNTDWIILQPLLRKNTKDIDCYNFYDAILPETKGFLTGIQNAKEYIGVGLNPQQVKKLYNKFCNFRAIKGEASSVIIKEEIKEYPKDLTVFNGRGGQEIIDNLNVGCKGIVPCLDFSDKLLNIYKNFQSKNIAIAEKQYKELLPSIVFVMQSIQTLICYGKRVCAYRMGVKKVYDRKPCLNPTDYGIKKTKQIVSEIGVF